MLGSQRSHCHDKINSGVIDSSEGVRRKGRIFSMTDRYRAGILDGHKDRQIRRLRLSRHSHSRWWILRWGWVFLEQSRILSRIQFTTHFIGFFVVETKRFVGSIVTVILTRQTCGQRSSKAAESKRRAQGNHLSERICYMFLISKCRETEI